MSDIKFQAPEGTVESPEINADYEQASVFDKVRVGGLGVYFRDGLKRRYIPYNYIDRVFIRIHEVNGKLCCGSTVFQYFRLVFVHGGKEFADVISEDSGALDDALSLIVKKSPGIETGFTAP